jgi:cation diffusion facilitator CzcD-associated flavoprotein CzcO
MAIDLIKQNKCRNFIILEKSSSVGGTWSDNKYPGCCCDGMYLCPLLCSGQRLMKV